MPKGAYQLGGLIVTLVVIVAFLPALRRMFARQFPEGFRDVDCKGVSCKEGEFCQDNVCKPIYPTATLDPVPGSF